MCVWLVYGQNRAVSCWPGLNVGVKNPGISHIFTSFVWALHSCAAASHFVELCAARRVERAGCTAAAEPAAHTESPDEPRIELGGGRLALPLCHVELVCSRLYR